MSNTGQENSGSTDFSNDQAQAFTTGVNVTGYKLTHVDIVLASTSPTPPIYGVRIYPDSSDGPDTDLGSGFHTLSPPSSLPVNFGPARFTAPGEGIDLAAGTKYWVVIDVGAANCC